MRTRRGGLAALLVVILPVLWGCPGDREADQEPEAATQAAHLQPEQAMRTALARVVEAQGNFFRDHNRYADSTQVLMDDYGFVPLEDTHVAINFAGTEPQWGYVATALHTFSNQQCEVLHGRATDGREFAGQIECTGEGGAPPAPAGQAGQMGQPGQTPPGAPAPAQPGAAAGQAGQPGTMQDTVRRP